MRLRPAAVRLHRWLGLSIAGFVAITGLSGALLAWHDELDAWLAPELLTARPGPGAAVPMDPLVLRDTVAQAYPDWRVNHVPLSPLPGRAVVFYVAPRSQGQEAVQALKQVLVDPYRGRILGERVPGEAKAQRASLMPFIHRLHHSLALGLAGSLALGAVALFWTVDCLLGLLLTLPTSHTPRVAGPARKSWLQRWAPAWKLRWAAGGYRRIFDMHRACGLWAWVLLLAFAWSSVAFNLTPVYESIMRRAGLAFQPTVRGAPRLASPIDQPALAWPQALTQGRRLMASEAKERGFVVMREDLLFYDPTRALYSYYVRSSLDVRERVGRTVVVFDASTGKLQSIWLPTGAGAGDSVTSWILGLHMAAMWGPPLKMIVTAAGLMTFLLSITGVLIWRRKSEARKEKSKVKTP